MLLTPFSPLASTLHSVVCPYKVRIYVAVSFAYLLHFFFLCFNQCVVCLHRRKVELGSAVVLDPFLLPYTPFGFPVQVEG